MTNFMVQKKFLKSLEYQVIYNKLSIVLPTVEVRANNEEQITGNLMENI